jgi:alpha-D-xyloside xylohydrolase
MKSFNWLPNKRMLRVGALLVAASVTALSAAAIPVQSFHKNADGVTLTMSPGTMRLTVCSDSIVRVMYSPNAVLPAGQDFVVTNHSWRSTSFKVADVEGKVMLTTRKLKVAVEKASGALAFYDAAGKLLLGEPAAGGKTMTAATVNGEASYQPEQTFTSPADEFIYGLGQFQEGIWNWRGMPQQLRQLNTEISLPMIVSSYGYGLLWNNASLTDFNPADTQVILTNKSGTFATTAAGDYVFFVKDGDRRNLIGVQVNGQTIAAITNMWVTYTLSAKTTLPANSTCTVTLLGGGRNAKVFARPLGNTTTFRSEVGDAIDYYFFYGPTADEIIAGYRQATGEAPLFPKAAYGFWQCRERYSSQAQMLAAARQFRSNQIPVDFIVQDWQYWGNHGWGAYEWDLRNYPNPTNMIAQLHAEHFKYMISVWSNPSGIVGKALASMPHGLIPGSQWMDVFNPAVRSLRWKYMDAAFFSLGTDAWWQDATEPGDDGNSVNGVQCFLGSANRVRNAYPLFASQATFEGQRGADPGKRVVILSRSAYLGEQRYGTAAWSGDVSGEWLAFARQIRGGLNFSITGLPYWTTDTGGFFHPRNQYTSADYNELLTRWFEWSTFCPILRIHGSGTATEIWNWLPVTQTNLIAFDQLRYRMLPYNYSVAWKITSDHYTPMRALVMDFPKDANTLAISDEYMFGPAFLVCPITSPQATSREVYLPSGATWVDFWTGETLAGGKTVTANAPVNILPLLVRAGSMVPLGPVLQYATEKPEDPVELRIYRGADGKFTLYEDEGDSYNYEKGKYATIPFEWNEARQTLTIGKRSGNFPGMLKERTFRAVFVSPNHGAGMAAEEKADAVVHYTGKAITVTRKP